MRLLFRLFKLPFRTTQAEDDQKARGLVPGVLSRFRGKSTDPNSNDEAIMAKVEMATQATPENAQPDAPERPARKGFGLAFPRLSKRSVQAEAPDAPLANDVGPDTVAPGDKAPKRGWKLSLTRRKSKNSDADIEKTDTVSPEIMPEAGNVKKRGLSLSLPFLRKKSTKAGAAEAPKPVLKPRRTKDAFEAEHLFETAAPDEAKGLSAKFQMICARLTTTERTPKALAGRPDPFDRLAKDAERLSTR